MYRIYINGSIHVQDGERLVVSPVLTESIGCAGSLEYSIPYNDDYYDVYVEHVTTAQVFEDGITYPIWEGRLLSSTVDLWGNKKLEFEGAMAMLNDIVYPPYAFQGDIPQLISNVLAHYNSKCSDGNQILIGSVTVTDPNGYITRSNEEYSSCWEVLSDKLVGVLGGYLRLRHDSDGNRFLDYLTDPGLHNSQKIEFGVNLLDIENYVDTSEIATVLIPQGAMLEDEDGNKTGRVDISSATGNTTGSTEIVTDFVNLYGRIETVAVWDDVTLPDNLYRKGLEYASQMTASALSITTKVIDLHLTDQSIQQFRCGDLVDCVSAPHGIEVTLLLSERVRNLNDPSQDTITLGNTIKTFSESTRESIKQLQNEQNTQKRYNANLAERIQKAKGLYTTVVTSDDGASVIWAHDQENLGDSQLLLQFSQEGIHLSGDGGATWWGQDFNGEFLTRLIDAYEISANRIHGGYLSSIAVDGSGSPITQIDMDSGDVARFGNIMWVRRYDEDGMPGNESLKWVGDR